MKRIPSMYMVQSDKQQLLVWGDIIHMVALQLPHPEATVQYDSEQDLARSTRAALLSKLGKDHVMVGAAHIAFPGLGLLHQDGTRYAWLPVNYDGLPPTP